VLSRRAKRRYLSVMHAGQTGDAVDAITKRCSSLFGSIAAEKAAIRIVKSENGVMIIKCRLDQLDNVLVAIALTDPPAATLDMSGSMKRLRRRLAKI
jgi:RNase P/RNase MRP subunit POP5